MLILLQIIFIKHKSTAILLKLNRTTATVLNPGKKRLKGVSFQQLVSLRDLQRLLAASPPFLAKGFFLGNPLQVKKNRPTPEQTHS
jgi:hypothetical protein